MLRQVLVVLGVVVVFTVVLVWWATSTRPAPSNGDAARQALRQVPKPAAPKKHAALTVRGVDIEEKDAEGNLLWKLRADGNFSADKDKGTAWGEDVKWELLAKNGQHWQAEAPLTQIDYKTGQLEFSKGVKVHLTDKSVAFSAPRLLYQAGTRKLVADGPVTLTVKGMKLTVGRLVVDTRTKELRAQRVHGRYRF